LIDIKQTGVYQIVTNMFLFASSNFPVYVYARYQNVTASLSINGTNNSIPLTAFEDRTLCFSSNITVTTVGTIKLVVTSGSKTFSITSANFFIQKLL